MRLHVAGLLVGCAWAGMASAAEPIRIGLIQPLTGSVAYNGTTDVNGAKLAVQQRNAAGGVLGRQVELVVEDGQCQPAASVNAAEKLIQQNKVVALAGAFCSSATAAVMPIAANNHISFITGVSSAADLTERGNKWFFRATETDALLAQAFAHILHDQLKLRNVAYIGVNDDWGRGSVQGFQKEMAALGGKVAMTEYFEHGTTDFTTLLTRLRSSGADGAFVAAETQDGASLVTQAAEFGVDMKIFGVGSWATADFMKLAGPAAEGIHAAVPYAATMTTPKNATFVQAYNQAYKEMPGKYGAAGYNSLNILMDAIQRAGGTDTDAIRAALEKTDYEGPNGHFTFDAKHQAVGFSVVLVRLEKGQPVVVATNTVQH